MNTSAVVSINTLSASVRTNVVDDALRALNRAETAIAIAATMESQWVTMVAENRHLQSTNDDLARRLAETERQIADLSALVLRLVS